ncbi:MAG: PadR family transcriptional regulator [Gemmatimonadota bacterium]
MPRNIIDSVQGTLEFLILKTLSWGEMHGYAIARWIFDRSREELQIDEGTLYPALHRMEMKGLIKAEWGLSENNRRAKYYVLTGAGRRELAQRVTDWDRFTKAVNRVVPANAVS